MYDIGFTLCDLQSEKKLQTVVYDLRIDKDDCIFIREFFVNFVGIKKRGAALGHAKRRISFLCREISAFRLDDHKMIRQIGAFFDNGTISVRATLHRDEISLVVDV